MSQDAEQSAAPMETPPIPQDVVKEEADPEEIKLLRDAIVSYLNSVEDINQVFMKDLKSHLKKTIK